MRAVTQEDLMGCGIACVASVLGKSYKSAKKLFAGPGHALSRGYYCREIVEALEEGRKKYKSAKISDKNRQFLEKDGTIVFTGRSKKYPAGHYLAKSDKGWMNPWINFPSIFPVKSGFQKTLPGKPGERSHGKNRLGN